MRIKLLALTGLLLAGLASPAAAQLVGTDTAPGSSCVGFPAGATRVTADADQNGKEITLICDGSVWQPAGAGGDDLGNHTATQDILLDGNDVKGGGAVQVGATGETCNGSLAGAMRYITADNELHVCNGTDWIPIVNVTGASGGGCTDSAAFTSPGQSAFTVNATNFGCTFRIKVYGAGGYKGSGSGSKGGAAQFDYTPAATGSFQVFVGAYGNNSGTAQGGGGDGAFTGGGGGGASAVAFDDGSNFTLLAISGGGGGTAGNAPGGDGGSLGGCGEDAGAGVYEGRGGCNNVGGAQSNGSTADGGKGGSAGSNGANATGSNVGVGGIGVPQFLISGGGGGAYKSMSEEGGGGGGGYGGGSGGGGNCCTHIAGGGGGGYINGVAVDNEIAITQLSGGQGGRVEITAITGTPVTPAGTVLDDLVNVAVPAPSDGDLLMYSAGMSQWVSSAGGVKIGNDGSACGSAKNGTIRYVSGGSPPWEFCNGSAWNPFKQPRCQNDGTGECYLQTSRSSDDPDFTAANIKDGVNILGVTGNYTGGATCSVNTAYAFPDVINAALSTSASSAIQLVDTDSCSAVVTISGVAGSPEFRICNDTTCTAVDNNWGSSQQTIDDGQYLQLRLTAAGTSLTTRTAQVDVGSSYSLWGVQTLGDKRVFVTSTTYNGNLGGLSGADAKCQARADAAGLAGTWKAWLSDSTTAADSRVTHTTYNYVLINGTVLANGWSDLTDGTIDAAIDINEFGGSVFAPSYYTNTTSAGLREFASDTNSTCLDWTSSTSGGNGPAGSGSYTDFRWTDTSTAIYCNGSNNPHLVCFEQ